MQVSRDGLETVTAQESRTGQMGVPEKGAKAVLGRHGFCHGRRGSRQTELFAYISHRGYSHVGAEGADPVNPQVPGRSKHAFLVDRAAIYILMPKFVPDVVRQIVHRDDMTAQLRSLANGRRLERPGAKDHETFTN